MLMLMLIYLSGRTTARCWSYADIARFYLTTLLHGHFLELAAAKWGEKISLPLLQYPH